MTGKAKIEVLAPAGGEEALQAAVFAGADAVYLGGYAFGARARARNFTNGQLAQAVSFCHVRGVKVHVTVNVLIKDRELPEVLNFVEFLCSLGVDAVLVQDMGLFSLLRERAPGLPLHASTQMSLHTPDGAKLLYRLGAKRVVLARELSLPEIREIGESCPIQLEAFAHGALCMSVSGQCYLSAMLGGRSGNRGMCAQPCRLPFAAPGGTGHDLSLKDLSFLSRIEDLGRAGVCSAKIEGRMKRPEYVAAAVSACRRAADGEEIPPELLRQLRAVFSRSGFTDGYLTGHTGLPMFGVRCKEDVTGATEKLFASLRGLCRGEREAVDVAFRLWEQEGEALLSAEDGEGSRALARAPLQEGVPPLKRERCLGQLGKTGGTPFRLREAEVPMEGVSLSISGLNALRREALKQLEALRGAPRAIPCEGKPVSFPPHPVRQGRLPLRVSFARVEQVGPAAGNCEAVLLPLSTPAEGLQALREKGFERIILELPRAMFGAQGIVEQLLEERMALGFTEVSCGNLGALETARRMGARLHGSFSLNITNTAALAFFEAFGLESAEASFELTGKELAALGGRLPRGAMVYGRQALMLTRNCPLANSGKGCRNCGTAGFLTDRKGKKFPVLCTRFGNRRQTELLNSVPLSLLGKEEELRAVDFGILRFTVENPVECERVLNAFLRQETLESDCTRGLFYRGVE